MNTEKLLTLNVQLFAEDDAAETDEEEVVESQEVDNSTTETKKKPEEHKEEKKSFVKIREDKAREKIFKELGVKDLDEAKAKLANADKALEKVQEIEKKLEAKETEQLNNKKVKELTKILDNEKVFDADALINYVNLDEIELKNDKISSDDAKSIIAALKEIKPNYFGKEFIKSDVYNKNTSNDNQPGIDYKEDYDAGNYQAVIAKYLKSKKN